MRLRAGRVRFSVAILGLAWAAMLGSTGTVTAEPSRESAEEADSLSANAPPTATSPERVERWRSFRFHPGPKSECGTFALTELSVLRRMGGDAPEVKSGERIYGSFDAGLEHNVSDAAALGGSVFFGLDEFRSQLGVRARARKWLSKRASLDLAPGVILVSKEEKNEDFLGPALVLRASLNLTASLGVTIQRFETRRQNRLGNITKERATHLGAQLNSRSGSVGLGVVLLVATATVFAFVSAL